jgi:hypothetical protein
MRGSTTALDHTARVLKDAARALETKKARRTAARLENHGARLKSYEFLFDMLPFMFVAPPLLVFVRVFEFAFEFDMFELLMLLFDMFALFVFVVLVFVVLVLLVFVVVKFEFDRFEFDRFEFVLVLSAGEQAVQTPATVSKARRAKVLRIEFPPEPF